MLAGAVARSGNIAAVDQLIARATECHLRRRRPIRPPCSRASTWVAVDRRRRPRRRGGGGGRGAAAPAARPVALAEPAALNTLAAQNSDTGALAKRVLAKLDWPNKPVRQSLSRRSRRRNEAVRRGLEVYKNACLGCHQPDGRGKGKDRRPRWWVIAVRPGLTAGPQRILLAGKEGPIGLMPPLGGALNDEQIASVLTYVRREWGSTGARCQSKTCARCGGLTKRARGRGQTPSSAPAGRGGGSGRDSSFVGQPFIPSSLLEEFMQSSSGRRRSWLGRDGSRDRWRCPAGRAAGSGAPRQRAWWPWRRAWRRSRILHCTRHRQEDGSVTKAEMRATFERWFGQWDSANSGALTQEQVLTGLNAALPQPPPRRLRWWPGRRAAQNQTPQPQHVDAMIAALPASAPQSPSRRVACSCSAKPPASCILAPFRWPGARSMNWVRKPVPGRPPSPPTQRSINETN